MLKHINAIVFIIMLNLIVLPVYSMNNYEEFSKKTDTIVEKIDINYTLKNASVVSIMNTDKNGVILFAQDYEINNKDNSRYIYIDYNGNITEYKDYYDSCSDYYKIPNIFCEGIARIKSGNKQGYINKDYDWITDKNYYYASDFSNGYGVVKEVSGKSYLIDINGKVCLAADDFYFTGQNSDNPGTVFRNGYAAYLKNNEIFYLDTDLNSVKIDIGNECDFNDGEFIFNGGTLVHMYPEKINGEYTHKQIYRIFGHDGKESYRYELQLPELEPVNDFYYINVLANGNVIFSEPEDFSRYNSLANIKLVSNEGKTLSETKQFYRSSSKLFRSIGDKICSIGTFYDENFNKLGSINVYDEEAVNKDGSVVVNIESESNVELNEIILKSLYIVSTDKINIMKKTNLVNPDKIKVNQSSKPKNITVYINNKQLNFDIYPITEKDRTLVPMRAIFEALGAEVEWENETQTATATKEGITVSVTIDSNRMLKNGEEIELDVPARLVGDSRTLVPLRAISEAFGCQVEWDEELQRVDIYSN